MTVDEIQNMPIEEIIHLDKFNSLTKCTQEGNAEFVPHHWRIDFKGEPTGNGTYKFLDKESPIKQAIEQVLNGDEVNDIP